MSTYYSDVLIKKEFKTTESSVKLNSFLSEMHKIINNEKSPTILINNSLFVYLIANNIMFLSIVSEDVHLILNN